MPDRFCSQCGAELVADAAFCIQCGKPLGKRKTVRHTSPFHLGRVAPLVVFGGVLLVGGAAVVVGRYGESAAPSVPGRSAPASSAAAPVAGELPEGHPPVQLPEDVRKMISDVRAQAEAAPDDVEKWRHLAGVEYRAGQLDRAYLPKAEAAFQHVLELQPGDLEALRGLGNLAFDRNAPQQAIEYYRLYLEKKPDDESVQTDLATMHMAKGDTEMAIQLYQKVLAKNPDFFEAHFNLGIAHRNEGDLDKALESFENAKRVAPNDRARQQVDEVIARAKGEPLPEAPAPASAPAPAEPAAGAAAAAESPFHQAVEAIFRGHPMLGPKLDGFEWQGDTDLRVRLRGFPMNAMPAEVRDRFTGRIRTHLQNSKEGYDIKQPVTIEIVDADSGDVMDKISE